MLRNASKSIAFIFIVLLVCGMMFFLTLDSISPPGRRTPIVPEFTFNNVGPCLGPNQDIVKRLEIGEQQYICADMETNEATVFLELYIFTNDKERQIYVDGKTFASGPISFYIYPPLPPGKYWAYISWSRPALVDFEFEVVEK